MERTYISWNLPNLVTVPLMAFIAFLVVGLAYQAVMKVASSNVSTGANNQGGY